MSLSRETESVTAVPLQASENAPAPAVTGALKVTRTFAPVSTPVSPVAGSELSTDGAESPGGGPSHEVPALAAPGVLSASSKSVAVASGPQPRGPREMLCAGPVAAVSAGAPAGPSV